MPRKKVIAILGQTASGKSALAVRLAKRFGGEIVSADSRQLYRDMNLGTGKISAKEMQGVPHHLLSVASPKRRWTVVQYERAATKAIRLAQGPVWLVGGSPFYLEAALHPGSLPNVPPNPRLRKRLAVLSTRALFTVLKDLDRDRARAVDRHNRVRVIRSIEIAVALGRVPLRSTAPSPYQVLKIGIRVSPIELKRRIDHRLERRMRSGMLSEVRRLRRSGLSWKALESFGLEYRYLALHLQGKLSRTEALSQLERAILQFARRQMTWWKRDRSIHWVPKRRIGALVQRFLGR